MNHKEVAQRVAAALGEDNLLGAAHCATRLRLVVKDTKKINQKALDNDPDLKGTFEANGQYQIIVGPGDVNHVYAELTKLTGVSETTKDELKEVANQQSKNPVMALIKVLSDIFVPLIPALVAGGLLMAINNILTGQGLFGAKSLVEQFPGIQGIADIVNMMASAPFAFLPILIGISATKRFGGNQYLGAAAGMMMVMPSLVNGYGVAVALETGNMPYWNIFGIKVAQAGYQGQVLPVIAVAFILATLEKFFHKKLSNAVDFTFTPLLSIIITGFLTFMVVGPVLRMVSDSVTNAIVWLHATTGGIGSGIFGLGYSAIVLTGLHQSFPAIETTLLADIAKTGGSFIFPIAAMANVAQGAATFAIFFISKNDKQKALASSAGFSAMLGITEPAMFGVNLKLKFPFFIGLIAAGISSAIIGFLNVLAVSMGPAGVIGFIAIKPSSIPAFMVGVVISFLIAFIGTFVYGRKKLDVPADEPTSDTTAQDINTVISEPVHKDEEISAVVTGTVVELKDVSDKVFSSELIGKGVAFKASIGEIYAPTDGVIVVTNDAKHAYGINTDKGAEILVHIGVDTVSLAGAPFTTRVKQGQLVKKGDLLGTFDIAAIEKAGFDPTVMMIVTNTMNYAAVEVVEEKDHQVNAGDVILALSEMN